jgi:hypothetical protein
MSTCDMRDSPSSNSIMEPLHTSAILVDHNFQYLTNRFLVRDTTNDAIEDLKEKVHEMWAAMGLSHYDPKDLVVWQPEGEMIIQYLPREGIEEKLAKIDIENNETIRLLAEEEKVADLGLLVGQSLIVQLPSTSCNPTIVSCVLI